MYACAKGSPQPELSRAPGGRRGGGERWVERWRDVQRGQATHTTSSGRVVGARRCGAAPAGRGEARRGQSNGREDFVLAGGVSRGRKSRVAGRGGFCEAGTASPPRHARTPQHVYTAYPPPRPMSRHRIQSPCSRLQISSVRACATPSPSPRLLRPPAARCLGGLHGPAACLETPWQARKNKHSDKNNTNTSTKKKHCATAAAGTHKTMRASCRGRRQRLRIRRST